MDDGQLYLDDQGLGDRCRSPGRTVGAAHYLLFAGMTGDRHPPPCDGEHARRTGSSCA